MGDTDVCPFDAGTYLAAVAAAARKTLLGLAAERWAVPEGGLVARDCRVVRPDGASLGYAELVRGLRRIELASMTDPATEGTGGRVAGLPTRKLTASDVVRGAHEYVLDMTRPGMLHGLVLRSPSFGATLRFVDLGPVTAMPGVVAVADGAFIGVAASDPGTACAALDALRPDWNVDPEPSEDGIVEYLRDHRAEAEGWQGTMDAAWGDVDAALASPGLRLEATYTAAYLAHVPLETRDAVAEWDRGRLTVWMGTQRPCGVRGELAEGLGLAEEDVRVIVPDTGGGFGGKHSGEAAFEAALLARAAGQPVRIRWTREEEMTWA